MNFSSLWTKDELRAKLDRYSNEQTTTHTHTHTLAQLLGYFLFVDSIRKLKLKFSISSLYVSEHTEPKCFLFHIEVYTSPPLLSCYHY